MAGLVRPRSFPIRDVKDNSQTLGQMYNPKRYPDHGGLSGASKWPGKDNTFPVEAPTRMRTASVSDRRLSE